MANPEECEKLNPSLLLALRAFREEEGRDPDDGITITLRFEGDLGGIEALGFETHSLSGENEALGLVRFKDIPALAAHPGVLWMAAGMPRKAYETAVADIRARASSPGTVGSGGDGLWHVVPTGGTAGTLTAAPDGTGAGVIVAVIDTGIDFTHPMFMGRLTPTKTTRIKRIWDQGLAPAAIAECPDQALILPGGRYGVEFRDTQIETAINGGAAILHKDCEGHGTHVAGIAAGGKVFGPGGDATKVGVAPEADIIAVKFLDTPDGIRFKLAGPGFGGLVDDDRRLKDALLYCLRTARAMGKPVVVNMSFGGSHAPGDALDDDARWVDARMDPAQPAGPLNFPSGAILVKSSGNEGDVADRQVARIVVPAGGEVTVPVELKDTRGGHSTKFKQCGNNLHNPALFLSFWYRRNFDNVKFAVKLPHRSTFEGGGDMGVGGNFDDGYLVRPGVPPTLVNVAIAANQHRVTAIHGGEPAVPFPAPVGGTVRRHQFLLIITPKTSGGAVTYLEGIYEIRIRGPAGTEVFMAGDLDDWGAGLFVTMSVATTMADGVTLPDPAVTGAITAEFSAVDTFGKHVITVGAYNDADHKIAGFSSRGPLRDFSDPPGSKPVIAAKPELAAPGVDINSAQGVDTNVGVGIRVPPWTDGVRFIPLSGTSMSAPMVAGTIALMLDKNGTLNTSDLRTHLTTAAALRLGADPPGPGTAHDRAYGSGMADALQSHDNTP